jgi:uncharacterized protein with von Willebrand factor type A (vWA) domain
MSAAPVATTDAPEPPSLRSQVDALWSNVLSRRAFLRQAEKLLNDPKHAERIRYEYGATKGNQTALEAGLETLRIIEQNPEIYELIERIRRAG